MLPARAVTIWPEAAVAGPAMARVAPLEAKRPPAIGVCSMRMAPDKVAAPEEADRKMSPCPLMPLAYLTKIGFAMVTPWSIWN